MGQALIEACARARDARGQTASEYMGILLIAAVIVAGAYKSGIVDDLAGRVHDIITAIGIGKSP